MSEIAAENLGILNRRWPALAQRVVSSPAPLPMRWVTAGTQPALEVAGHRLWSAYDADAEALLQAERVPGHSRQAAVYGVGGGDLIRVLLARPALQRLHVVILNTGLFHFLLHSLDHRDWLGDPRVKLLDGASQPRPIAPFAVVPPCITLSTEDSAVLRDHLVDELLRPFERQRHKDREPQRKQQIAQNLSLIQTDGDVHSLFNTQPDSTIFVAIAGPTLAQTAGWIRHHRAEGHLIAVDGALGPLLDRGIVPDIVVSVDENRDTILKYFARDLSRCKNSLLVYAPLVHHDVLRLWPGRRLTTYTFEAIYDELRTDHPKSELFVAGSVSHPTVDLAVKMGAKRIVLFGADFGFPNGKIHANEDAPIDFYANAAKAGAMTRNGHGEMIGSLASFNGYRLGLEDYIARHPQIDFLNMSRDGAFIRGARYVAGDAQ